jgi:hypothetical protein
MSTDDAPAGSSEASPVPAIAVPAPASWPWRRAALLPAGAAQLITTSALVRADPIPATWPALQLAVAPAPVAAAAFAPNPANLAAAAMGISLLVAGIAGQVTHTGLFFVPALAALAVAAVKLWREQSSRRGEGVFR